MAEHGHALVDAALALIGKTRVTCRICNFAERFASAVGVLMTAVSVEVRQIFRTAFEIAARDAYRRENRRRCRP
jgi:hypothetical protein